MFESINRSNDFQVIDEFRGGHGVGYHYRHYHHVTVTSYIVPLSPVSVASCLCSLVVVLR